MWVDLKPGEHDWITCCDECGDDYCTNCLADRGYDDRDKKRCEGNDIQGPMPEGGYDG